MRPERVSDHAVLGYLQRVAGVDVERVRRHIAEQLRHTPDGTSKVTTGGIEYRMDRSGVIDVVAVKRAEPEPVRFDDG